MASCSGRGIRCSGIAHELHRFEVIYFGACAFVCFCLRMKVLDVEDDIRGLIFHKDERLYHGKLISHRAVDALPCPAVFQRFGSDAAAGAILCHLLDSAIEGIGTPATGFALGGI